MSLNESVKNSALRARRKIKERRYKNVLVFEIDPLPEEIEAHQIVKSALDAVPNYMSSFIDAIYIGKFPGQDKRSINAKYADRAIYLTNEQDDLEDAVDDVVHELAHAVEDNLYNEIYHDGLIEREFLQKRSKLFRILSSENYSVNQSSFMNPEYDISFDSFLYSEVGYANLAPLSVNLFHSPYAITSLREYFANGFEAFFLEGEAERIKAISPRLYEKLVNIMEER